MTVKEFLRSKGTMSVQEVSDWHDWYMVSNARYRRANDYLTTRSKRR